MQKKLLEEIKKTIVFIGSFNERNEEVLWGTGFLVQIEDIFHLVTARHVPFQLNEKGEIVKEKENIFIFVNGKQHQLLGKSLKKSKEEGFNWVCHDNKKVDIAIIPLHLDPENEDVKVVPESQFLAVEELVETYDTFYLSYQPGISQFRSDASVLPIIRKGIISRINKDKSFYIDGTVFPGNSGSPVFLMPAAARFTDKGISLGDGNLGGKFIGVIGEYLPYRDVAISQQTGRPRVIFEENTGLSKAWSVNHFREILENAAFKKQISSIKKKLSENNK